MSEKELQNAVVHAAVMLDWLCYHTRFSIRSQPGYPDLTLVNSTQGRVVFAELKGERGRLSLAQQVWQVALGACPGVEVYVWWPDDWRDGTIERVLRGEGG